MFNIFIKIENDLIVEKKTSYANDISGWDKLPIPIPADLTQELSDFENKTGDYSPENTMTYAQKRQQVISKGGYGTWQEQLEILNEQGLTAFKNHCTAVKERFPK